MSNIESKTSKKIHSIFSPPRNVCRSLHGRIFRTIIMIFMMSSFFAISTSYLSQLEESELIENQYFLPELTAALRESLSQTNDTSAIEVEGYELITYQLIGRFFSMQNYNPVFTSYNDLNRIGYNLLDLTEHANYYGLESRNYHVGLIRQLQAKLQEEDLKQQHVQTRTELEILFADAAMKFMIHLHSGYRMVDSTFYTDPYILSLPRILTTALTGNDFNEEILSCQPDFIEYVRLQQATENYVQHVELTENWIEIHELQNDSLVLWKGIKEVLQRLGYAVDDTSYSEIVETLRSFQIHHGLEPDGKPGKNTLDALSQSSMHKYRILALNLDRLRKQEQHESHFLFVNVPAYNLKVIKGNEIQQTYRVCVGRPYSPTPLIDGNIDLIVTNPEWNVPKRIARNEILPKIVADADYLKLNRFNLLDENMNEVNFEEIDWNQVSSDNFNYSIQQRPSSGNALGQVKFVFKNPYSIYLHDTPSKNLFSKDIRAFSHGCVRVENPEELAAYIVEQLQPEYPDVRDLINRGIRREINLQRTMPVQIRYITCEGDEDGSLYYYKDIYGLDEKEIDSFLILASL